MSKTIGIDPAPPGKAIHVVLIDNDGLPLYSSLLSPLAVRDFCLWQQPDMVCIEMPTTAMRFNPKESDGYKRARNIAVAKSVGETRSVASEIKGLLTGRLSICCINPDFIRSTITGWHANKNECRGWTADKWIAQSLQQQGWGPHMKPKGGLSNESKRDAGCAAMFAERLLRMPVLMLETQGRADCSVSLLETAKP